VRGRDRGPDATGDGGRSSEPGDDRDDWEAGWGAPAAGALPADGHAVGAPWGRDWGDGEHEPRRGGPARRTPPLLLVVAVLPWVVVAAVVLHPGGATGGTAVTGTEATPTAAHHTTDPTDAPDTAGPTDDPTDDAGTAGAAASAAAGVGLPPSVVTHGTPLPGDVLVAATAAAEVLLRTWRGTIPTEGWPTATSATTGDGAGGDAPAAHVDHVVTERVTVLAPDRVVVTLLAVVLTAHGDTWDRARVERHAVAIALEDGVPRPTGAVWPLPAPPPPTAGAPTHGLGPAAATLDDPDLLLAATASLVTAGWRDPEVVLVTDGALLVALVSGTGPDDRRHDGTPVWLEPTAGGLLPAGAARDAPASAPETPTDDATQEATP
jgi:hypothetical protein